MDNYKMHDMGEKRSIGPVCEGESPKEEIYHPTTYISSKKIPDIAEYDVGDECEVHSLCRIKGKRIEEVEDGEEVEVTLETLKMGVVPSGDTKKMRQMNVSKENYAKLKEKGMV